MIKTGFIATAIALASLGAAPQIASAQSISIQLGTAPPPPRYEVVPVARYGQEWVPGHWEWRRGQYVWRNGSWVQARAGYYYNQPQWVQIGNQWQYRPGSYVAGYRDRDRDGIPDRYERNARGPNGDRDRDGIPNRFDNNNGRGNNPNGDRDRDGIANRNDRDRDGDGVANRNDRNPNNPRRN